MTTIEVSKYIKHTLSNLYPSQEINAFTAIIFNHLLNYSRLDIHLQSNTQLLPDIEAQIYDIINQLERYRPIQYIIGSTEFYDLKFLVNESVLIPRPETEELVHWIIDDYTGLAPQIIDIGTGSGCIAVTLAKKIDGSVVTGVDISPKALNLARENAAFNAVNMNFIELDILANSSPEFVTFDVIVSNPPYVTIKQKDNMSSNVLNFEPHLALFVPENNPLIFYTAIASFANKYLKDDGSLYFEINEDLSKETTNALSELGFTSEIRKDINGKCRMIKAKRI